MSDPKVTISLLTRNRPDLLRLAIEGVLAQQGIELELLVLDNASTDDTPEVVRAFRARDPRVVDLRSDADLGMVRNWNRGIDLAAARAPFACVFHDDDVMLPGFLAESTRALLAHPSAAFACCLPQFVSPAGEVLDVLNPNDVPDGLTNGLDYLELAVNRRAMGIYPPTVVFRSDVLKRLGPIDTPHAHATMDLNLYYRALAVADVVFIRKVLAHCRQHAGSETDAMYRQAEPMFRYSAAAELIDAAIALLRSPRSADPRFRAWLAERISALHLEQSESLRPLCPRAYHAWETRRALLIDQIERAIPRDEALVLIDDQQLALTSGLDGRAVYPFIERDGEYWGVPSDDRLHAIEELERLRRAGARWVVVAWPSRWWLEVYRTFREHLQRNYRKVSSSPHGVIFDVT
jgi:glycosyltransferase involved in cell wall biosynthesis